MVIGYLYVIESNTDNQNWVPTVDDIDLSTNYTEGLEFIKLQIPQTYRIRFKTGIIAYDSGSGRSYVYNTNRRAYAMLAEGIETSRDNAETIRNFFMLDRHCSGTKATNKALHLIIKYGTTDYEKFIDASSMPQDYCKGVVLDGETVWDEDEPQVATVRLNWRSVW